MKTEKLKILAVAAHPDDIELLCAGTRARYAAEEHRVWMAVFTSDNMGDTHIKPEPLAVMREKEARDSAALIGARLLWPAIDDEHVFPSAEHHSAPIAVRIVTSIPTPDRRI